MRMLLVVGTGYTGRRILERERAARGLSRSLPDGIDASRMTIADLDESLAPIEAIDAVVYTVPPPDDAGHDHRLAALLSAFVEPPARFVYLSTTGVYGDRQGQVVRESDDVNPQTARAQRRVTAEQQLDDWATVHGVSLVVLRVPGIYGPGRLMLDRVKSGEPVICEADASPGNRIHVDDLVSCCLAATTAPAGIYNLGDGDTRSSTWFTQEVARQIGAEPLPEISFADAQAQFSERRLSFLSESRTVDTTKMREVLGVTPAFADAADGIRASLAADGQASDRDPTKLQVPGIIK